ncbi:MAG TPA: hypothetical protein VE399_02125 [Gemmatimonadales bacterium]|nr:hypothetical protein [Gemmatimonadales bacterium]
MARLAVLGVDRVPDRALIVIVVDFAVPLSDGIPGLDLRHQLPVLGLNELSIQK